MRRWLFVLVICVFARRLVAGEAHTERANRLAHVRHFAIADKRVEDVVLGRMPDELQLQRPPPPEAGDQPVESRFQEVDA